MKKLYSTLCLALAVILGSPAHAEIVLYCQTELATGFIKDKNTGSWRTANFNLKRYTIKFNDDYKTLSGLGSIYDYSCNQPYSFEKDFISCRSDAKDGGTFLYNLSTKRFFLSTPSYAGFVENSKKPDTDTMKAGTCQKF